MAAASPAPLLDVWEQGLAARPASRTHALLRVADPTLASTTPEELLVGAADAALISLRSRLFGREVEGIAGCPECGEEVEVAFGLDELRLPAPSSELARVHVRLGGQTVAVRRPRVSDLLAAETEPNVGAARRALLRRVLADTPLSADELPEDEAAAIGEGLAEVATAAAIDLSLDCPSCGASWLEEFDPASFLWDELDTWARRLLADVHVLASAYGWTEQEVLALADGRREVYLELAAS
jgi:hypothetical protein